MSVYLVLDRFIYFELSCMIPSTLSFYPSATEYEGNSIEIVDQYKYLGVVLDEKLSFDKHVNHLFDKSYPKLKLLNNIRSNIGQSTSIYLYNCMLHPLFGFNDYIYDNMNASDANELQVLQNICIRTCLQCDPGPLERHCMRKAESSL